ncbi:MAG: preprotein translocase subunit SecG [Deltaproteobacteria bacterium]|jgi:preprotein translocase subunit SecG|nr:preprotein translocase subunit SecG [Deltaproteobacteria bacterium]
MDYITSIYLIVCVFLVLVILFQQGSGADAGVSFGGGGNTLFGASGADTLLIKITTGLAVAFMCCAVYLTYLSKQSIATIDGRGSISATLPDAKPKIIEPTTEATNPAESQNK